MFPLFSLPGEFPASLRHCVSVALYTNLAPSSEAPILNVAGVQFYGVQQEALR